MTLQLIAFLVMLAPFVVATIVGLAEVLFWCFCWCFCKVEEYFQERFMRKITANLKRLERIAAESEKKANAA